MILYELARFLVCDSPVRYLSAAWVALGFDFGEAEFGGELAEFGGEAGDRFECANGMAHEQVPDGDAPAGERL
jgi:hypothetical protein